MDKTNLIAALGLGVVWLAAMASCGKDDPENLLTTNATNMSTTTGGAGGNDGGGGDGGNGASGGNNGGGGTAGEGGAPEEAIHGCLSTTASTALTGLANVTIEYPGTNLCYKLTAPVTVDFNVAAPASSYRIVYGLFEDGVKTLYQDDNNWTFCEGCPVNPHYCPTSPYMCTEPPAMANALPAGVYPFFDDKAPATIKGVLYVE
jgi:hypothetical protein